MTFAETRRRIQQMAADEFGISISVNRSKVIAAAVVTLDSDYSSLTYNDPTGERAIRHALADMLTREETQE